MREKKGQRKGILRESSTVALVLALLTPFLEANEIRGANLVITKNDGTIVQGELLAVKGLNLLIMNESAPDGVSVGLADANLVKVVKRGKVGLILGGVLIGGAAGVGLGYAAESGHREFLSGITKAAGAAVGGGIGMLAGGVLGLVLGSNKKFQISDTNPDSLNLVASRLRKLAREKS